jgi:CHAD domain-containing protein
LEAGAHWLPLAAHHYLEDVEHVHQLRVSCRRAGAAVAAFEPLLGRGKKRLSRWLKQIRRAAGPARDADVLLARWTSELAGDGPSGERLLAWLQRQRSHGQQAVVSVAQAADDRHHGFAESIEQALGEDLRTASRAARQPFRQYARRQLRQFAADSFDLDASAASIERLHQLRIDTKRLRYAIEIFHSGLPRTVRKHDYPVVQKIQSRLGKLNDHAAAQHRCQALLADLPADGFAAYVAELVIREHRAAEEQREAFLQWWSRGAHELLFAHKLA